MSHPSGSNAYLRLKAAHELFNRQPGDLDARERERVERTAARLLEIEQRILATPEAARVVVPETSLQRALGEVRGRYASAGEFCADLENSGLDLASLRAALERELAVAAVLEQIADALVEVSETDVEIYYLLHRDRFVRPENRSLRHILVTINDALPGNERGAARASIDAIRRRLDKAPKRFGEQAHKYSECPTAMNSGQLGAVRRGQLYPELEAVAFALAPGEISAVVESPLGFHLLQCISIEAACLLPLSAVRQVIRERIGESRRTAAHKEWIAGLFREAA